MPSGTVTFLFTDIEGSTRLAQEHPEAISALLRRHHEILRRSIESWNGHVYQIVGDSISAAFASAVDALNAAIDAQRCLLNEAWAPAPIRVRMGIHTGITQLSHDRQYSGYATLALSQRVMSAGHGGQILLSGATRELVRDSLPADSEILDLGERRLKDMIRPEHLYQLNAAGLPSSFPPLKTLDSFPNNLPIQLTSFIGREREITEVKKILSEHRLVTLTGAGGTGKTRLSLQVAADVLGHFPHGIWFVELAPLADPELIPQTILSAMGIHEQAGRPSLELLKDSLRGKKSLLILDNCEHLIDASARLTDVLLNTSPELTILASSREALGVRGEHSYPVPSLSSPDIRHLPVAEKLSQYEAVRLFIDRASLVSPHFVVDKDNAPFIAQICYRLDGIPLAIELAAARVKMMSVEQISNRLDDRFRLLTGGARTALPRQQTLRALIDWSYDILSESERLLLRRLSVFAGSWTLDAAEAICADEGMDLYDVLDLLTQLVNKSLVVVVEKPQPHGKLSEDGALRYRMLETIRQYGREKLLEADEGNQIRDRHFDYYSKMARKLLPEFFGPKELIWLVWLEDEWDNLRAAVEWSIETRPDASLELVTCLGFLFLDSQDNLTDMQNWLMQLLSHPANAARTTARARGLLHWAWYATANYESSDRIQSMIDEAVSILQESGDKNGLAHGYLAAALAANDLESGLRNFKKALALFHETRDKVWTGFALLYFGWLIETQDYERKLASLQESLAIYRELGFISGTIEALKQLGALALRQGNFELAHLRLDEGLKILQEHASILGNSITMSYDLGDLAYYEGNYELARIYYESCLSWASQKCLPLPEAWAHARLGYLYTRLGEGATARLYYHKALIPYQTGNTRIGVLFTVEGLASLAVSERRWDQAVRLFSWATNMREESGELRPPVEQAAVERDLAVLRASVTATEFSRLSGEGSTMTMEQAIALALEK
ncbi:MAG TPA: adenylate/guanylate cyclase domain-containing protein [Anaerolineales bacterium]|nr:adenylate/guanylate cyclase domain-containing protein [Anaerolineales bacterium]